MVTLDFSSSKPGKRKSNPHEFSVEEYKEVNPELVKYRETKQIKIQQVNPTGISYSEKNIYMVSAEGLHVFGVNGKEILKKNFTDGATCVYANEKHIFIGSENYLLKLDSTGQIICKSDINPNSWFTSIAQRNHDLYVADAGNKLILKYNTDCKKTGEFAGQSRSTVIHGFIIPSAVFDVAINPDQELWVVNPGIHALQHYRDDGSLIDFWEKTSIEIEGFSGCCNPAHIAFLPNGNLITSEKGMVRIKEYSPKGDLLSVVAEPMKFEGEKAPDIAVDEQGNILALDMDKKMIRIFQPK
ncbi:MAG: hypothetical protein HC906_07220 [Bacteroidales bacterium]|nr:hypothetical protein [Bacteroidales bacterium]